MDNTLITLMADGDTHHYLYFDQATGLLTVEERVHLEIKGVDRVSGSSWAEYRHEIRVMKELGYKMISTSETDLF
jgi:hypothetical protein